MMKRKLMIFTPFVACAIVPIAMVSCVKTAQYKTYSDADKVAEDISKIMVSNDKQQQDDARKQFHESKKELIKNEIQTITETILSKISDKHKEEAKKLLYTQAYYSNLDIYYKELLTNIYEDIKSQSAGLTDKEIEKLITDNYGEKLKEIKNFGDSLFNYTKSEAKTLSKTLEFFSEDFAAAHPDKKDSFEKIAKAISSNAVIFEFAGDALLKANTVELLKKEIIDGIKNNSFDPQLSTNLMSTIQKGMASAVTNPDEFLKKINVEELENLTTVLQDQQFLTTYADYAKNISPIYSNQDLLGYYKEIAKVK